MNDHRSPAGDRSPGADERSSSPGDRSTSQDDRAAAAQRDVPGADAERPGEIPAGGWWRIVRRAWKEASTDQVPLLAAGVAFFGFLSLFPAVAAIVLGYGLVAEPSQMRSQVEELTAAVPASARDILLQQVESLAAAPQQGLGIGLVIALATALWSASGGVGYLISAVNLAYDEEETRGFVKRKLLALGLTLGAIVFVLLAAGLLAVGALIDDSSTVVRVLLQVARLAVAIILITIALAVVYRVAPDRDAPRMRWVSVGAAVATVIWLLASIGFSVYVSTFGNYAKTYGSLAAVAILLLWLWLTAYAILLGAEINAESEQQTVRDTTKGPPQPLGERNAVKADSPPG
ncbi:ribonuclease BN [Kribbella flavida DSM 17836]|uniref:Ribonuclease BN n=1 Tax=Kribbella flavida (strain DSM 17836 / JCM 10339 / NBRC 14399) TaxID=479435 RepID=D2PPQ9_KRIFD|nr:YihY/virulence factor BrkB family protein [Kribbella flavida]ADB31021.1 ribonuclease BN [Kribbella flavida DSM 17836]